jgi:hypothetical protein
MNKVDWIKPEEQMPSEGQVIWVTSFGWSEICVFHEKEFRSIQSWAIAQDVTAWAILELPEPFK